VTPLSLLFFLLKSKKVELLVLKQVMLRGKKLMMLMLAQKLEMTGKSNYHHEYEHVMMIMIMMGIVMIVVVVVLFVVIVVVFDYWNILQEKLYQHLFARVFLKYFVFVFF